MRIGGSNLAAGFAGALIGGFVAGISVYFLISDASSDLEFQDLSLPDRAINQDPATDLTLIHPEDVASVTVPDKRVQTIKDLASLKSDFDRSMSIHLLIANANEDTLETYIGQSMEISSMQHRNLALSIIFRRFVALDPQRALDQFLLLDRLRDDQRYELIGSIFDEWMHSDFNGAIAAITALNQEDRGMTAAYVMSHSEDLPAQQRIDLARQIGPNDAWIEFNIEIIRRESHKEDPRGAFYARIRDKSRARRISDLSSIARDWFEIEGASVIPEISASISDANTRRNVLNNLFWQIGQDEEADPSSILNVVMNLPNKRDAQLATERALNAWAMSDPKQSFETSLKYDNQLITREIRSSLLEQWAQEDPEGLLMEASSFPSDYRDTAVVKAIGHMALEVPEEAVRLASDLETPRLIAAANEEILEYWSRNDAKSAVEWYVADSVDDSEEEPESHLRFAFQSYMRQDFESAMDYVNQYDGLLKDWFVSSIAQHLVQSDVERAIEYLPNLDEDSREWVEPDIGYYLVRQDPHKALSYGETIEANYKKRYFNRLLQSWANYDLMGLHDNIQKVPNEYRVDAARQLLKTNDTKHFLSEREIQKLESMLQN